jgi:hypothetical protein
MLRAFIKDLGWGGMGVEGVKANPRIAYNNIFFFHFITHIYIYYLDLYLTGEFTL